ncbi:MAG: hypothetical protein CMF31_09125 [Kordiimonas sp.]|nr:hypothetical protein [Kordiimonas sp.]
MINGINTYGSAVAGTTVGRGDVLSDQSLKAATENRGPTPQGKQKVDEPARVEDYIEQASEVISSVISTELLNTKLQIDQDELTGLFVYKGVDRDSGEVVKQYPPEKILDFLGYYREAEGLVVDSEI